MSFDTPEAEASYVEGLRRELGHYRARGENERAADVVAELARLGVKETAVEGLPERAVAPKPEKRKA